ncbi:MAG: NAD(P)-dependent oxidoreductase [Verrucomicrobia bacterium]|nr:NAD(P)-dependent oxidoreductase [Verrucomicrobiota bacterium]
MKKILILGASGAIGRYLVDYFYDRRHECDVALITGDLRKCDFVKQRSDYFHLDVSKKTSFEQLPEDIYAVIDLATIMPARMVGYDPKQYIDTNICGTYNVLEFCKSNNIDRLLFAHTFGDILHNAENDPLLKVDLPPIQDYADNKSVYIATMNTSVELIKCYHAIFKMKTFLFRLPTIYNWDTDIYCENGEAIRMAWRILIDQATSGKDIHVWGDPNRKKDMVYVKDLCQMFYKACFADREYGFYNVGTGVGISLLEQITGMIEVFGEGTKSRIHFSPEMRNAPQYIMCIDEAKKELGYEPQYKYVDMLKDMKKERDLDRFK